MKTPSSIKFGTDGWRAVIAKDFTTENVARVAKATADWVNKNYDDPSIVVGYDCRFGGRLFLETIAKVVTNEGITVKVADGFVSTPMVSLGTKELGASLGVVITASHNPPEYNGYKLKGHYGGPLTPDKVQEVENLIPDESPDGWEDLDVKDLEEEGKLHWVDLEKMYIDRIRETFDIKAIEDSELNIAYDAMYGAGQNVFMKLFPEMDCIHCRYNPSFKGQAPEPISKNLQEFSEYIRDRMEIDCGLATDGDADRLGLFNGQGKFVDSHHIMLLLIHYLVKHAGMKGKVVSAFSSSVKIGKMAEHYGLEHETVPIGFKHIAGLMLEEDVLIGGEESGGIAINGHIPERDGIWMGMVIWEFMAKTGSSLNELIREVYDIVGKFAFERSDLHLKEDLKQRIVQNCEEGKYQQFGDFKVDRVEDLDGYKFFFNDDEWLMIRPSGTEPVLRTYAEATDRKRAHEILRSCRNTILEGEMVG